MTGRVLRKTVVSMIAAEISTRRFFRMEPGTVIACLLNLHVFSNLFRMEPGTVWS